MTRSPRWFARVGEPLASSELIDITALLDSASSMGRIEIAPAESWIDVARIVQAQQDDAIVWDLEEDERARLWMLATERFGEDELMAKLATIASAIALSARNAATDMANRSGLSDLALLRAATAGVLLAAHQNAVASLAGETQAH